jgi:nicotinate-nucleotide adenylyltransferase
LTSPAIGILGGTFDPIHLGHMRLAEEVADALGLTQVRFVLAGRPPHRTAPRTGAAHRVAMTRLALAGNARFVLDDRETRRAGLSYTVDTLSEIRAEAGAATPLVLMLGADAFAKFDNWRRWRDILDLAHVAVAHRPGADLSNISEALRTEWQTRRTSQRKLAHAAGAMFEVAVTALDISATHLRAMLADGRSARYLVAPDTLSYIEKHHLYSKEAHAPVG